MASIISTVSFTPNMKRSYSVAFDEDDCHQQQKWHISERLVAASSTTGLQQVWGKTMDRLNNGSKQFWNSNQPGISCIQHQVSSNTEIKNHFTNSLQPADRNSGQKSIKNYFNSTSSRQISRVEPLSTPMDTMDSPPPSCSSSNLGTLPHTSKAKNDTSFGFAVPSTSKASVPVKIFGDEAGLNCDAGAVFGRTPGVGSISTSSLRQLTLNKCGRFAGSFVPRGLPDTVQTPLPSCSDCQVASQQPWYLLDPSLKCHDCDRPHCTSCLKACFKCEQPFCALCRMNSFQHSESHKTVCFGCIS